MPNYQRCAKCNTVKPASAFNSFKVLRFWHLNPRCKDCNGSAIEAYKAKQGKPKRKRRTVAQIAADTLNGKPEKERRILLQLAALRASI